MGPRTVILALLIYATTSVSGDLSQQSPIVVFDPMIESHQKYQQQVYSNVDYYPADSHSRVLTPSSRARQRSDNVKLEDPPELINYEVLKVTAPEANATGKYLNEAKRDSRGPSRFADVAGEPSLLTSHNQFVNRRYQKKTTGEPLIQDNHHGYVNRVVPTQPYVPHVLSQSSVVPSQIFYNNYHHNRVNPHVHQNQQTFQSAWEQRFTPVLSPRVSPTQLYSSYDQRFAPVQNPHALGQQSYRHSYEQNYPQTYQTSYQPSYEQNYQEDYPNHWSSLGVQSHGEVKRVKPKKHPPEANRRSHTVTIEHPSTTVSSILPVRTVFHHVENNLNPTRSNLFIENSLNALRHTLHDVGHTPSTARTVSAYQPVTQLSYNFATTALPTTTARPVKKQKKVQRTPTDPDEQGIPGNFESKVTPVRRTTTESSAQRTVTPTRQTEPLKQRLFANFESKVRRTTTEPSGQRTQSNFENKVRRPPAYTTEPTHFADFESQLRPGWPTEQQIQLDFESQVTPLKKDASQNNFEGSPTPASSFERKINSTRRSSLQTADQKSLTSVDKKITPRNSSTEAPEATSTTTQWGVNVVKKNSTDSGDQKSVKNLARKRKPVKSTNTTRNEEKTPSYSLRTTPQEKNSTTPSVQRYHSSYLKKVNAVRNRPFDNKNQKKPVTDLFRRFSVSQTHTESDQGPPNVQNNSDSVLQKFSVEVSSTNVTTAAVPTVSTSSEDRRQSNDSASGTNSKETKVDASDEKSDNGTIEIIIPIKAADGANLTESIDLDRESSEKTDEKFGKKTENSFIQKIEKKSEKKLEEDSEKNSKKIPTDGNDGADDQKKKFSEERNYSEELHSLKKYKFSISSEEDDDDFGSRPFGLSEERSGEHSREDSASKNDFEASEQKQHNEFLPDDSIKKIDTEGKDSKSWQPHATLVKPDDTESSNKDKIVRQHDDGGKEKGDDVVHAEESNKAEHHHPEPRRHSEAHEKGGGGERHEEHHEVGGDEGKKGYSSHHEHEKQAKGYHDKESHKKHYDESIGDDKKHLEDSAYREDYRGGEKKEKAAEFEELGKFNKGHSTKGNHVVHKKDEFEKLVEFYDESHEEDGGEKSAEFHRNFEKEHGGHDKSGHHRSGGYVEHHGKKHEHGKGHHYTDHESHGVKGGHKEHHHGQKHYGEKSGHGQGKKWAYKKR